MCLIHCAITTPSCSLKKTQEYNRGVSESWETVLSDIPKKEKSHFLWKYFVLCYFADLFHAQTVTLHTKKAEKRKKHDLFILTGPSKSCCVRISGFVEVVLWFVLAHFFLMPSPV